MKNLQQSHHSHRSYLSEVSAGNINASHTEGNVMVAKKLPCPMAALFLIFRTGQAAHMGPPGRFGIHLVEASALV